MSDQVVGTCVDNQVPVYATRYDELKELMDFYQFSYQPASDYKGTGVFELLLNEDELKTERTDVICGKNKLYCVVRCDPVKGVQVSNELPEDQSEITFYVTMPFNTFHNIFWGIEPVRSFVLSSACKVRNWAYSSVLTFSNAFDFSTQQWQTYYEHKSEKEIEEKQRLEKLEKAKMELQKQRIARGIAEMKEKEEKAKLETQQQMMKLKATQMPEEEKEETKVDVEKGKPKKRLNSFRTLSSFSLKDIMMYRAKKNLNIHCFSAGSLTMKWLNAAQSKNIYTNLFFKNNDEFNKKSTSQKTLKSRYKFEFKPFKKQNSSNFQAFKTNMKVEFHSTLQRFGNSFENMNSADDYSIGLRPQHFRAVSEEVKTKYRKISGKIEHRMGRKVGKIMHKGHFNQESTNDNLLMHF